MLTQQLTLALKYLDFATVLDEITEKYFLDDQHARILRLVTRANLHQKPLRVLDILELKQIASPATLHKFIYDLIKMNLIKLELDNKDQRVKYLIATPIAFKMFSAIGQKM